VDTFCVNACCRGSSPHFICNDLRMTIPAPSIFDSAIALYTEYALSAAVPARRCAFGVHIKTLGVFRPEPDGACGALGATRAHVLVSRHGDRTDPDPLP